MRTTRTHTRFFSDGQLADLTADVAALTNDFEQRARHIDADTARAGRERLTAVHLAVERLRDVAD